MLRRHGDGAPFAAELRWRCFRQPLRMIPSAVPAAPVGSGTGLATEIYRMQVGIGRTGPGRERWREVAFGDVQRRVSVARE